MNNLTKKIVDNLNKLDEMLTREKNFIKELKKHLHVIANACYAANSTHAVDKCDNMNKFITDYETKEQLK